MNIIKTHNIILSATKGEYDIILCPLTDEHLPLLYKWNADCEVVFFADSGKEVIAHDEQAVRGIYGNTSQSALCFLLQVNGVPVGEFWLQKMNVPEISKQHPNKDVRRIDGMIGEKEYWGKGIGTTVVETIIDFAFNQDGAEIIYWTPAAYNTRSNKLALKLGFEFCGTEEIEYCPVRKCGTENRYRIFKPPTHKL